MKILSEKRCIIGEGPIWSDKEQKLYYTNGLGNEICIYDFQTDETTIRPLPFNVAAFAFNTKNQLIVSHEKGVHILNNDNSLSPIYDTNKYRICNANDMKVGPDGAIYVGSQSSKRLGISNDIDGKLYRISPDGLVNVLIDNLLLSNGMEWSLDEKKFYHTDSDTRIIKEYNFDKITGKITFTGRQIRVGGVDGFTIDCDNNLYVSCWGQGHIAVIDTDIFQIKNYIPTPCKIPASCAFCGKNMNVLAITTASYKTDISTDKNAGFTILKEINTKGRLPYLYKNL